MARGFAVLVPERPGHGATGGKYLEDQGGCDDADYSRAGYATADSIKAALGLSARGESFIRQDGAVVIGHSAGGWGALALAERRPETASRRSSCSRRDAAAMPTTSQTRSARRTR